jgi:hypothetical protein
MPVLTGRRQPFRPPALEGSNKAKSAISIAGLLAAGAAVWRNRKTKTTFVVWRTADVLKSGASVIRANGVRSPPHPEGPSKDFCSADQSSQKTAH